MIELTPKDFYAYADFRYTQSEKLLQKLFYPIVSRQQ